MSCTIINGDALTVLRTMPSDSIDCCVSSPPYFGLRNYGVAGQLGLEPTPEAFVSALADVFDEVRRVLKPTATCWINLGDSYVAKATGNTGHSSTVNGGLRNQEACAQRPDKTGLGLKPKDLIGIPWRCAFELQRRGWWLRSDIIWHKPNPMPESVTDRPTKAHEYMFLLTKSARYFYDAGKIAEPAVSAGEDRGGGKKYSDRANGHAIGGSHNLHVFGATGATRNRRTVWTIASQATPDAHFAVFPIEIPETCILAGCPPDGMVLDPFCGSGTTGLAALKHGRRFTGIELNSEYITIAHSRVQRHCPLLAGISA